MRVRLKNPSSSFYDPETKLRIDGGDIVEVGRVGYLTRQALNAGGIIVVPPDEQPTVVPDVTTENIPEPIEELDPFIGQVIIESEKSSLELIVEPDVPEPPKPKITKRGRPKKKAK